MHGLFFYGILEAKGIIDASCFLLITIIFQHCKSRRSFFVWLLVFLIFRHPRHGVFCVFRGDKNTAVCAVLSDTPVFCV